MPTHPPSSPLTALAHSFPGPVVTLDVGGAVVGANSAACELLGQDVAPQLIVGRRLLDVVQVPAEARLGGPYQQAHWKHTLTCQSGPSAAPSTLVAVVTVRGESVELLLRGRALQKPLGPGWLVELGPAGPSQQGAPPLERDRLRQVFDTTQIALLVTDLNGVVAYASPRASVLFCTSRDQLEGERIDSAALQLLRPDGSPLPPNAHPLARVLNGDPDVSDDTYGFESAIGHRLLRIGASPVLSGDHRIAEYVFTVHDITEAQRDRHELERAERSLSHAQKLGGVGSWETDLHASKVWWSEQLFRLFDLDPRCPPPSADELRGRIHPDDRQVHADFERRLWDQPGRTTAEFRVLLRDGTYRRLRAFAHHETGPAGSASGHAIGFLQDVTEQRRSEEAQQQARLAAESANRAKSEFLAVMSHELRTPLNAVRGFADLIMNSTGEDRTRTYARYVVRGADNLTAIIQDILDISSIEAGQVHLDHRPFAPWGVVGEVCRTLMPKATARGLSLMSDVTIEVPPFITGDAQRILQILLNLVGNAIKFTENGIVSLRVAPTLLRGTPALEWIVEDTGIGIPADKLTRIFDTFTQVDSSLTRPYDGVGLGLSISKRLAELMGGHIHVNSEVGHGSTFRLMLPYDHAAGFEPISQHPLTPNNTVPPDNTVPDNTVPDNTVPDNNDSPRPVVLVVEDDPINTVLILEVLKTLPVDVEHTGNGERAVELARSISFDAILMDVQLPGMSGLQATRRIRNAIEKQPAVIIGISAHALDQHRSEGLESGMDLYLPKPIRPSELLRELRNRLDLD